MAKLIMSSDHMIEGNLRIVVGFDQYVRVTGTSSLFARLVKQVVTLIVEV